MAAGRHAVATRLAWEYSVPCLLAAYRSGLALPLGSAPAAAAPPRQGPVCSEDLVP